MKKGSGKYFFIFFLLVAIFILACTLKISFTGRAYQETETYQNSFWSCPDGNTSEERTCKTYSVLRDQATQFCENHCRYVSQNTKQCNPNFTLGERCSVQSVNSEIVQGCSDSDSEITFPENLKIKGTCEDESGTYTDIALDDGWIKEYYCGPTESPVNEQSCLSVDNNCIQVNLTHSTDGVCSQSAPETSETSQVQCTDSDGYYPSQFGIVYWTDIDGNQQTTPDLCSGTKVMEAICNANNQGTYATEMFECPHGCSNGACVQFNATQENQTASNQTQTNLSAKNNTQFISAYPVDYTNSSYSNHTNSNYTSYNTENNANISNSDCNGCLKDGRCYFFGYRKSGEYCSDANYSFVPLLEEDSFCENNFECVSNVCFDNKCVSTSLIQKILNWLKELFS